MTSVKKYRKKPVVISAMKIDGSEQDINAVAEWMMNIDSNVRLGASFDKETDLWNLEIGTLEGTMTAAPGSYIICDVNSEFYPCEPSIFKKTYEEEF